MVKNGVHMKSVWLLLAAVILLCAMMPISYAETLDEWNRSCRAKTTHSTPVYESYDAVSSGSPVTTIPANTYVKISSQYNGIASIKYMTHNGNRGWGYVKSEHLAAAIVVVPGEDGTSLGIQELQYQDQYGSIPDKDKYGIQQDNTHRNNNTQSSSNLTSFSGDQSTFTAQKDAVVVRHGDEAVQLICLGEANSTIMLNGEEKEVPTIELDFGSTAEKEKQVAVIHAPKTGKCTLRSKASDSGKALQKCKAGTVVMVLEYGRNWCKISDNGNVGYVQTDCLKWYDAETEGTGLLSYNGRTTGSTTINVRNTSSGDSAKIVEWPTGTKVEVFGLEKGWYEIEYDGIHGFVMEKYLTLQD